MIRVKQETKDYLNSIKHINRLCSHDAAILYIVEKNRQLEQEIKLLSASSSVSSLM